MESDLHPMSNFINLLFKFADDTNLIVPQITDISARAEINNIRSWAFENKMEINWDKTKELVFRRPNIRQALLPDSMLNIEQVQEARLLGVEISGKFNFTSHVNYVLTVCAQRCYILKVLRQQGLPLHQLHIVYCALIVNIINYALPAWSGFLTAGLINRLNAMLKKCHSRGFSEHLDTVQKIMEQADNKLFRSLQNPGHCAHYLLPPLKPLVRARRRRLHNYELPVCKLNLHKNSFICRHLYKNCMTK
jgi:large-conductance mechanosensitive channel